MVLEPARRAGRAGGGGRFPESHREAGLAHRERAVPPGRAARLGRPPAPRADDGAPWRPGRGSSIDLPDLGVGACRGSPGRPAGLGAAVLLVLLPLEPATRGSVALRDPGCGLDQRPDRSTGRNTGRAGARNRRRLVLEYPGLRRGGRGACRLHGAPNPRGAAGLRSARRKSGRVPLAWRHAARGHPTPHGSSVECLGRWPARRPQRPRRRRCDVSRRAPVLLRDSPRSPAATARHARSAGHSSRALVRGLRNGQADRQCDRRLAGPRAAPDHGHRRPAIRCPHRSAAGRARSGRSESAHHWSVARARGYHPRDADRSGRGGGGGGGGVGLLSLGMVLRQLGRGLVVAVRSQRAA